MPLPHVVARYNKRVTNRFIEPLIRRTRGFAVVHHIGRRSGRRHRTPVVVFRADRPDAGGSGTAFVALTYGPQADWFQNVRAGAGVLEVDRTHRPIIRADLVGRVTARPALPWFVRVGLRLLTVCDFARLSLAEPLSAEDNDRRPERP